MLVLGLLNSAQFVGNLIALPFTPFLSDIYGRRAALLFGGVIMCVGVGIQSAAWNVPMFIGARFTSALDTRSFFFFLQVTFLT